MLPGRTSGEVPPGDAGGPAGLRRGEGGGRPLAVEVESPLAGVGEDDARAGRSALRRMGAIVRGSLLDLVYPHLPYFKFTL